MRPTVGRIVLYTSPDGRSEVLAAIITKVRPLTITDDVKRVPPPEETTYAVSLHVFYAPGYVDLNDVPFTPEPPGATFAAGKWSWPPRV